MIDNINNSRPTSNTRKLYSFLGSFLWTMFFLTLIVNGCSKKQADSDDDKDSDATPPSLVAVKTAEVTAGTMDITASATGKTEALKNEKVLSPIAGRILSLKVLAGMPVKTGDIIATIQTKESYAGISGAEALLSAATTPEGRAEAQRTLDLAKSTQSTVTVRAKFDGVVSTKSVSEGELVSENSELVTILDLSSIIFNAEVLLKDVPSIHVHQKCSIKFQSLPDVVFQASVDAINPQSDLESQTVQVRLRFENLFEKSKGMLKTDMIGTARIITGTHQNILLAPKTALLRDDETGTYSVVVVTPDSLAKTIAVVVGEMSDSTVEISSDEIQKGMSVVIEGNYALPDSTKVKVVN